MARRLGIKEMKDLSGSEKRHLGIGEVETELTKLRIHEETL